MTKLAAEAARIVDALPPEKAEALLEYARFLVEKSDEEEWDRQFSNPKYAPKFKAFLQDVEQEIAAGKVEDLKIDDL